MASTTSTASREWKIENSGRIPQTAFQVVIGLFFGIAVASVIARLIIRIMTRRKLYLGEVFLIFGVMCLGAATGLAYMFCHLIFLSNALRLDARIIPTGSEIAQLINSLKIIYSFLALIWTTTFAVKCSFLAFFKPLIERVSKKVTIYYWVVVAITTLAWMFIVSEPFILCPYFGIETVKCLPETPYTLTLALTTFITILDISTDVMIVSIPIIILRRVKIKTTQKLSLGVFLCLSLVMVVFALTRISAYRLNHILDLTWEIFWQYMEGCIAVIMASVTAFRTVFVASGSRRSEEKHRGPSDSMRQRLKIKLKSNRRDGAVDQEDLPTIPRATLTGMRTFIRRNNRPVGETTVMRSEYDFLEDDYHAVRKGDQGIYVKREWTAQSHRPSASLNNSSTRGASII